MRLPYFDKRSDRFEIIQGTTVAPYVARMGDLPAITTGPAADGLMVVLNQTAPSTITYPNWAKFQRFADHKDFPGIRAVHLARGLPEDGFTETYVRYVKSLIGVGSGVGADRVTGLETEFVALANPYTDDLTGGFPVQLLYQDKPRPDAQVEIFERGPDGFTSITTIRSDANGRALVPVKPGHSYLLDAVVLRPAPEGGRPVWETLWAALSFAVPANDNVSR